MYAYFSVRYLSDPTRGASLIRAALLKYGYSNFSLEILEYCDPSEIVEREQYYLDLLKPEYNIIPNAADHTGHVHTPETKAKMSAAALDNLTDERKEDLIGHLSDFVGKSGDKNPFYGKHHSEETKDYYATKYGSTVWVYTVDENNSFVLVERFVSIKKAAFYLKCAKKTISIYAENGKMFRDLYRISFTDLTKIGE